MALNNPKYKLEYTIGGTAIQRRDSLVGAGPLSCSAQDHYLCKVLPEFFTTTNGGATVAKVTQHGVEQFFLPGCVYSNDIKDQDLSWVVLPKRFTEILSVLDAANELDWTVRRGKGAWSAVHAAFMKGMQTLTKDERMLCISDVIVPAKGAEHDTFYDKLTGNMMSASEWDHAGTAWAISDLRMLIAGGYSKFERDVDEGVFETQIDHVISVAGPGVNDMRKMGQASAVAVFIRSSAPPQRLRSYVPFNGVGTELARRGLASEHLRFVPLLVENWELAFPPIKAAFSKDLHQPDEIIALLSTLAVRIGLAAELTESVCNALSDMLGPALLNADSQEFRELATNGERGSALAVHMSRHLKGSDGAAQEAKVGVNAEQRGILLQAPHYKALVAKLEALSVSPMDYSAIATAMAGDPSALGVIFLTGGAVPGTVFDSMKGARVDYVLDGALNAVMALDRQKQLQGDWSVIKHGTTKALLKGNWNGPSFNIYEAIAAELIKKRDSVEAHKKWAKVRPEEIWSSSSFLEMLEPIAVRAFAFIGYVGSGAGTVKSFFVGMRSRAADIETLPEHVSQKRGLQRHLQKIAAHVMNDASANRKLMLVEGVHVAKREPAFAPAGARASLLLDQFDLDIIEVKRNTRLSDKYDDDESSGHKRDPPDDGGSKGGKKRAGRDDSSSKWKDTRPEKGGDKGDRDNAPQGSLAWKFGIWSCPRGFTFGAGKIVLIEQDATALQELEKLQCYACLGPAPGNDERSKLMRWAWCSNEACQFDSAHEVPEALAPYLTYVRPTQKEDWSLLEEGDFKDVKLLHGDPSLTSPFEQDGSVKRHEAAKKKGDGKGKGKGKPSPAWKSIDKSKGKGKGKGKGKSGKSDQGFRGRW